MIDIDKTIEGDAVLSVIKYCVLSKINYRKAYKITSGCLKFIAVGHNIEVQFLTDRVDRRKLPYIFTNIVGFLEDDKSEKTVYDILKKIQPICGQIIVDGERVEMKEKNENGKNDTGISIETLKQMGYNYPFTVRRIIEGIEQGKDLKDIKSGLIESRIAEIQNGHILFLFSLSDINRYNNEIENEIRMMDRMDIVFFIDRVWVPSNDRKLLHKVFNAICDEKTVEEALECLKEEKTAQPERPKEEEPKKYPGPLPEDMIVGFDKGEEVVPKSKDETAPQPNSNNSDLRNAIKSCEAIFEEKMRIYGYSFCYMHPETVTDQLYMKATILKKRLTDRDKCKRLGLAFFEGMRDEFAAVVNYGIIALRQGGFGVQVLEIPESPMRFYSDQMQAAFKLIIEKGSEYGELWRKQRIGTFADMIYTKVRRLKGIEDRYRIGGLTKEDYHKFAEDQYKDMINYGLFGIVRLTAIIKYEKQMEGYARFI